MAKQKTEQRISRQKKTMPEFLSKRLSEGGFILILACALFTVLSLVSYDLQDPGLWGQIAHSDLANIANAGGLVGSYLADCLYHLFGYYAFLLPICSIYVAWVAFQDQRRIKHVDVASLLWRGTGMLAVLLAGCGLLSLEPVFTAVNGSQSAGGVVGDVIAETFNEALNIEGATLLLLAILLIGTTLLTGLSWIFATEKIGYLALSACRTIGRYARTISLILLERIAIFRVKRSELKDAKQARKVLEKSEKKPILLPVKEPKIAKELKETVPAIKIVMPEIEKPPVVVNTTAVSSSPPSIAKPVRAPKPPVSGSLPPLSLLDVSTTGKSMGGYTHQELETMSREVEQHLLDFGVHADVVAVHPGPVITRFELQLAAGIKVSKLSALAKDLARSLSVISVRVVEVIPGKTVVGIELPNQQRDMVRLSEVLSADVYQHAHSPVTLALGVDIAGHPMVVDLGKMPHLLVAGTTGSGKSVGINAMILSILFKATPEQVRLIMVDPKMLELSVYDGIPHLLTPVVTDMKEAASALRWCVAEMERRYRLMASLGVRNLAGYNTKINESMANGESLRDPLWKPTDSVELEAPLLQCLPYIVVVIDELADMMMVVGKKVEQLIARIAQKARAAGIHLILATQRPSVDVLTGLIKSNIPTRMSFQVSSKIDSRTILDQQGAEQLLGHGDMLYLAPGTGAPLRIHGAFVDDKEVHRIADDWRARGEPNYIEEITQSFIDPADGSGMDEGGGNSNVEEADPLYDQAVEFVLQTRKASISSVQRRLKVGYNRAARLIEEMERCGLVGPLEGGFRDVLVQSNGE